MEDRSALFNQLKEFSQRKLKKVETKVVTASGEQLVEKRGAKGLQVLGGANSGQAGDAEPARKLDLQLGLVLPGFLIGSQDVAHDKSSLESYGITHILNLAPEEVPNKFEDDYNYKDVNIQDRPSFELSTVLEDCFDFVDDGRHYGNVLIHCAGTIGLSRSTSICVAYLMNKEKQRLDEALNNVKEVRSFVKPSEAFMKQLREYEVKLRGAQQAKESGIDDPFALRKKQEIEQEKAMVAGASSVKNRMKMFGQTLDTSQASSNRSKSVSPMPAAVHSQPQSRPTSAMSKATTTPEPPASQWQSSGKSYPSAPKRDDTSKNVTGIPPPPPPPPPPMPSAAEPVHQIGAHSSGVNGPAPPPPPPPPPMLAGELPDKLGRSAFSERKAAIESQQQQQDNERKVFGKVPPPPMKIKGGLATLDHHDSATGDTTTTTTTSSRAQSSLKLPLKKQYTTETSDSESQPEIGRSISPSAALRAAKQQVSGSQSKESSSRPPTGQLNRSSTKKLLNLIKTKTKTDLTLPDGDENDEIDALLGALESESIDQIDWDELGLDEEEVKDIIKQGGEESEDSSSSSESEEESEEDGDVEEETEYDKSSQHFIIRSK